MIIIGLFSANEDFESSYFILILFLGMFYFIFIVNLNVNYFNASVENGMIGKLIKSNLQ